MRTTPTGRRDRHGDRDYLVLERTFAAPVEDVWAAVTEPERLQRWIGTWTGDPASGQVTFRMTAEGEDVGTGDLHHRRVRPAARAAHPVVDGG